MAQDERKPGGFSSFFDIKGVGGGIMWFMPKAESLVADGSFIYGGPASYAIPVSVGTSATLRADADYYVITDAPDSVNDRKLLATSADALHTDDPAEWSIEPIDPTLAERIRRRASDFWTTFTHEDGSLTEYALSDFVNPDDLIAFWNKKDGRYITFEDLARGLAKMRPIVGAPVRSVPLAQYSKTEVFQNHDFGAKAIDGLFHIAMGEKSFELAPRSGKSRERYVLTGSEEDCTRLFKAGANTEQVRAVIDTVQSLLNHPQAAEFVQDGRIWFTVNKIVAELLRTSAGTVVANKSKATQEIVERVLVAVTGARVQATTPNGSVTKVVYLLDAIRLDKVTYNGETYRDVWGFSISSQTLSKHSESLGRTYRYAMPTREKPFTLDSVWIEHYLSDALHEARHRLYTTGRDGKLRRRKGVTKVTIKRDWQKIFDLASPTRALDSRQKGRLVRGFEAELTDLVREEARGERHEGAPLYVRAWSERDGGRGRGKGAYRNLCIEASTTFRAVRDGSKEHGNVVLQEGVSKAAPENSKR